MNKQRRKQIEKACEEYKAFVNKLDELKEKGRSLLEEFERLRDEEQEYLDNMPENLHGSDKHDTAESSINELEELHQALDSFVEVDFPDSDTLLAVI